MGVLNVIGVVAFCLASGVVGVRLALPARRTRELPEIAVLFPLTAAGRIAGAGDGVPAAGLG